MPQVLPPKRVLYSLKALCCLARMQGPMRASELARCTGIPPAQAAKILYLLTWGGFVCSRRGSKGGYWLRVPAERIRVQEVMEFFHPPADRGRENSPDPILQVWHEMAGVGHRAFAQLTLANLAGDSEPARPFRALLNPEGDWPACS